LKPWPRRILLRILWILLPGGAALVVFAVGAAVALIFGAELRHRLGLGAPEVVQGSETVQAARWERRRQLVELAVPVLAPGERDRISQKYRRPDLTAETGLVGSPVEPDLQVGEGEISLFPAIRATPSLAPAPTILAEIRLEFPRPTRRADVLVSEVDGVVRLDAVPIVEPFLSLPMSWRLIAAVQAMPALRAQFAVGVRAVRIGRVEIMPSLFADYGEQSGRSDYGLGVVAVVDF
jgi:hypothetical protein